jgi:tetratricopeptide (TPR) repeat protein
MNSCRWVFAFLFSAMVITSGARLAAQASSEDADMAVVIDEAIALFQSGDYERSIAKFQQAYSVLKDPNILFNIGRCYHLLGDKENAIEYYNRFVYYPNIPEDTSARAREYLKKLTEETGEGAEEVTEGAEEEGSGADEADHSAGADSSEGSTDQSDFPLQNADSNAPPSPSRAVEWSLIGSGIALTLTGGILSGLALSNQKKFDSSHDFEEKDDYANKGKALALAGDISMGVGIAAAAAGVILLLVRGRKNKESEKKAAFTPRLLPGGAEMSWSVQF